MAKKPFRITAGPSREALFDALRLQHEGRNVALGVMNEKIPLSTNSLFKSVEFEIELHVAVTCIGAQNGSGNLWTVSIYDEEEILQVKRLEAYYNTKERSGWVRPL